MPRALLSVGDTRCRCVDTVRKCRDGPSFDVVQSDFCRNCRGSRGFRYLNRINRVCWNHNEIGTDSSDADRRSGHAVHVRRQQLLRRVQPRALPEAPTDER